MCVKAPDYLKDMFVRAKLQFEGFDNATEPQKPHRESVRPVFALCHEFSPGARKFSLSRESIVSPYSKRKIFPGVICAAH